MSSPDWQSDDGTVQLYCADCMDVLPDLDGVDAVVTDPPYGEVNRETGGLRSLHKGVSDVVTFSVSELARTFSRVSNGSVYIWCGIEQVSEYRRILVLEGLSTRLCGWEKSNPSPMNGERMWLSSFECCIFARRAGAWFGRHCASPIWRGPTQREQVHPTQKPLWLMRELVSASVPPDGCCLDAFMGSGTTGVACVQLGRRFIGIEKEPRYFEIAVRRIKEAFSDQGLFNGEMSECQMDLALKE